MAIKKFRNQSCDFDANLLKADEFSFATLIKILPTECSLAITDSKRFIICHSRNPFPVWIWLCEDVKEDELELVYQLTKKNFEFSNGYKFNMKQNSADFFQSRCEKDGINLKISMNITAYCCPKPIPPSRTAKGFFAPAGLEDLDLAVAYMDQFHRELNLDQEDMEAYKDKALSLINNQTLFFWIDENGEKIAMASYTINGNVGAVSNVFTRQDKRRGGYAQNLVYAITLMIQNQGKAPILYADSDYAPSNRCYQHIGYICKGSICTLQSI